MDKNCAYNNYKIITKMQFHSVFDKARHNTGKSSVTQSLSATHVELLVDMYVTAPLGKRLVWAQRLDRPLCVAALPSQHQPPRHRNTSRSRNLASAC